jgi:hypothetical protein
VPVPRTHDRRLFERRPERFFTVPQALLARVPIAQIPQHGKDGDAAPAVPVLLVGGPGRHLPEVGLDRDQLPSGGA